MHESLLPLSVPAVGTFVALGTRKEKEVGVVMHLEW